MRVPLTIGDFLARAAGVYGDREALVDEPGVPGSLGRITYTQLHRRARGMACELERRGVAPGDRVAIVSPNSGRFLVSFFGVSGWGRVLVPVNYRLTADEIRYVVEHSGASVLLVDPEYDEALRGVDAKVRIVLDGERDAALFAETDETPARWAGDEDATASINYTSGTTARPKGVQLTHRNCWLNAAMLGWHLGVGDRDVYLHTLPMFHANGWGMPYAITGMGGRHVVQRKVDGEEILRRIAAEGVTVLAGAPAVVAAALDAAARRRAEGAEVPGRGTVRMVVGGAAPPTALIERVGTDLGWEFVQAYGLTESAPLLLVNRAPWEWDGLPADERARRLSRAGVPALGVQFRVAEDGGLAARANHVFAGYWNQPEETAEAIRDGWFHTGDSGYRDGPYTVISDRQKDVIITGGENVSSLEVEDVLYRHPAVAEVAVIGVPDAKWGETVKALVVTKPGTDVDERELVDFCRAAMAHFKCPRSIEFRDALARTATGKLQKFKLREPYWAGRDRRVG
jgi:acyl-CoA synthetase (AMP-forming)/AMP-acid ligase II